MDDSRLISIAQLQVFLQGSVKLVVSLEAASPAEKYAFIDSTVDRFTYAKLSRKDQYVVYQYIKKITGYKKVQLWRLIKRAVTGKLERQPYRRVKPHRIYTSGDIKLLEQTDEVHVRLSDRATQAILRREYELFGKQEYQTIARISHGHITNLRHHPYYVNSWVNHTKARVIPIGLTQPPQNYGKPGSIRLDAVHQRDVYHINAVDEITQWEVVVCVPIIAEICMLPALELLLDQFPFVIFNFHSDRGGETINYLVADMLQHLLIKQTKSRSNHPNDNALVETKNGSIIRKNMGWEHIHSQFANTITEYYRLWFNPYLNFHRPCAFPTIETNQQGKTKKVYTTYQPPYETLKQLPQAQKYLKPGITFAQLDTIAYNQSDNDFARLLREEEKELFSMIRSYDHRGSTRRQT